MNKELVNKAGKLYAWLDSLQDQYSKITAEKKDDFLITIDSTISIHVSNLPKELVLHCIDAEILKVTNELALLGRIASVFDKRHAGIIEAQAGKDEQLNEGYAHFKPADYKRYIAFYTKLIADLTSYGQVKKATKKAAVRKPPGKEKLVAKLCKNVP